MLPLNYELPSSSCSLISSFFISSSVPKLSSSSELNDLFSSSLIDTNYWLMLCLNFLPILEIRGFFILYFRLVFVRTIWATLILLFVSDRDMLCCYIYSGLFTPIERFFLSSICFGVRPESSSSCSVLASYAELAPPLDSSSFDR